MLRISFNAEQFVAKSGADGVRMVQPVTFKGASSSWLIIITYTCREALITYLQKSDYGPKGSYSWIPSGSMLLAAVSKAPLVSAHVPSLYPP